MIFVTVGTHEQPFDRLVRCVDEMKGKGLITEDVIIQTGFSTYEPQYCTWSKLIPHKELAEHVQDARIIVTHGGPASFIAPLQLGKIPIVMPRRHDFNEHVNNHQVEFAHAVAQRNKNILVADTAEELEQLILDYDHLVQNMPIQVSSNKEKFNEELTKIVAELMGE